MGKETDQKKPDFIEFSNNLDDDGYLTEFSKKRAGFSIGGTTRKRFVRFRADVFDDLMKAMKSKNCSYVTYFDELVKGGYLRPDGYPFEYIAAMLKHTRLGTIQEMEVEELTSKLLNYFNLPTVYNKTFYLGGRPRTLSVDFLKNNEQIIPMSNGNPALKDTPIEQWDSPQVWDKGFRNAISKIIKNVPNKQQIIDNIMQDIFKGYLYRAILLGDYDYSSRNLMIIYDPSKNDWKLSPNLDFEMALTPVDHEKFTTLFRPMLDFIKNKYPDIFNQFLNKISTIKRDRNIVKIINSSIANEKDRFKYYFLLKNNARMILDMYPRPNTSCFDRLKQEMEKKNDGR